MPYRPADVGAHVVQDGPQRRLDAADLVRGDGDRMEEADVLVRLPQRRLGLPGLAHVLGRAVHPDRGALLVPDDLPPRMYLNSAAVRPHHPHVRANGAPPSAAGTALSTRSRSSGWIRSRNPS